MPESLRSSLRIRFSVSRCSQPDAARNRQIGQQTERPDRALDHGDRAGFQHELQRGRVFIADDRDQGRPRSVRRISTARCMSSRHVVFDGEQHDVRAVRPGTPGSATALSTMQPMRRRCSTSLTRSLSGG